MPTKRTRRAPRQHGLRAAAIEAWQAGDHLALHRALGLLPWEASPIEAHGTPPAWAAAMPYGQSWPRAAELRRQLIEASRSDPHSPGRYRVTLPR
jgi:hypothetical protein